jgi:hypothetical protein
LARSRRSWGCGLELESIVFTVGVCFRCVSSCRVCLVWCQATRILGF